MNHDIINFYFLIPSVHPVQLPWKTGLFFPSTELMSCCYQVRNNACNQWSRIAFSFIEMEKNILHILYKFLSMELGWTPSPPSRSSPGCGVEGMRATGLGWRWGVLEGDENKSMWNVTYETCFSYSKYKKDRKYFLKNNFLHTNTP